jgi:hypothetical protein
MGRLIVAMGGDEYVPRAVEREGGETTMPRIDINDSDCPVRVIKWGQGGDIAGKTGDGCVVKFCRGIEIQETTTEGVSAHGESMFRVVMGAKLTPAEAQRVAVAGALATLNKPRATTKEKRDALTIIAEATGAEVPAAAPTPARSRSKVGVRVAAGSAKKPAARRTKPKF